HSMIIGTSSMGLYHYDGQIFTEWKTEASDELKQNKINNGIIQANHLIFGTIVKGIYVFDLDGHLLHHLHSGNGLQNNTVLAIQNDEKNNIWVGLDKGFDFVWFHSPVETYRDANMEMGSVYTAAQFQNELYLGSNQGIYYYEIDGNDKFINRRFLENSQGQVWFLKVIDNKLYCGLNDGTYVINKHQLSKVSDINGGYNLKQVQLGEKRKLLQSTYNEIVIYENEKDIWQKNHVLDGFVAPARYLELDYLGNIFLGHAVTGMYLVQASTNFDSVIQYKKIGSEEGISFKTNRVFKLDNRIVTPSGTEIYQWDALKNKFIPFDELNKQLGSFAQSKTIVAIGADKYWFIKANEMGLFEMHFGKATLLYRLIPEMFDLELVENYENIVELNDQQHLICLQDGFAILDLAKLKQLEEITEAPMINEIVFWKTKDDQKIAVRGNEILKQQFTSGFNNFLVSFSAKENVGRRNYFQFYLEGIESNWSDWQTTTKVEFTRLPPGNYTFRLRGLTAHGMYTPETVITLHIAPPWYLTWLAYVGYLVLFFVFFLLLYVNFKRRQWRKQERFLKEE
ncbi:MAG: triple tyrosine motif-containing protein, partial [Ignavibacteria bacterium]|nr:triple tyrosine motif-containing protein [Ignavibacteria bacterium]